MPSSARIRLLYRTSSLDARIAPSLPFSKRNRFSSCRAVVSLHSASYRQRSTSAAPGMMGRVRSCVLPPQTSSRVRIRTISGSNKTSRQRSCWICAIEKPPPNCRAAAQAIGVFAACFRSVWKNQLICPSFKCAGVNTAFDLRFGSDRLECCSGNGFAPWQYRRSRQ